MRPITPSMQRALNSALVMREGDAYAGVAQVRGLIRRGLAVATDYPRRIEVTSAGFAAAEPGYAQSMRDRDHAVALAELGRGAVVDYRGTYVNERGAFYVVGFDPGHANRYVIADRDYPWFRLSRVRRTSLDPTGELAELCRCEHEYTYCWRDRPRVCAVGGCNCTEHAALIPEEVTS